MGQDFYFDGLEKVETPSFVFEGLTPLSVPSEDVHPPARFGTDTPTQSGMTDPNSVQVIAPQPPTPPKRVGSAGGFTNPGSVSVTGPPNDRLPTPMPSRGDIALPPMGPPDDHVFQDRIDHVMQQMAQSGMPISVISAQRTQEQQEKLYRQGRSSPGHIVTEKSGRPGDESLHQMNLARDFQFVGHQNPTNEMWQALGRVARENGLEWGGDWTSLVDRPHVQMPKGK